MTKESSAWLLPHLTTAGVIERYRRAAGKELESGKIANPESSAALAANTFGYFMPVPGDLPAPPGWTEPWEPFSVLVEAEMRFPWQGGHHPWLDAVVETKTHLIGIESKRYEPYRGGASADFSQVYWREVWGKNMGPYEWLRDGLKRRPQLFRFLDAAQLIKHAFGLRTQSLKKRKKPVLVYLYAQPKAWPDGRRISDAQRLGHEEETRMFSRLVEGAEVTFCHFTYQSLLEVLGASKKTGIREHVQALRSRFDC